MAHSPLRCSPGVLRQVPNVFRLAACEHCPLAEETIGSIVSTCTYRAMQFIEVGMSLIWPDAVASTYRATR
jgi:hypothetical protein